MFIDKSAQGQLPDLQLLTFSAKIDYITIHTPAKVRLPALTGKAIWPKKERGRRLTVHDASARDIVVLTRVFGPARLIELEVAVDVRPAAHVQPEDREAILKSVMVNMFARGLKPDRGLAMKKQFRAFYRWHPNGCSIGPFNKRLPLPSDQQLHGGRHDAVQVKTYLKRSDARIPLHPEKQVARVEVRLGSEGLLMQGIDTLADVKTFKFRKHLMPYFSHVMGTARLARRKVGLPSPLLILLTEKNRQISLNHWNKVGIGAYLRGGTREGDDVRFIRNTKLNNRIGQALGRIDLQFQHDRLEHVKVAPDGESTVSAADHFDRQCVTA